MPELFINGQWISAAGSPANIRALAAVSYQQGESAGSSVILYIAESQS